MVLELGKLLPFETLIDFEDEVRTEKLIGSILEHQFFCKRNIHPEIKAKMIKCRFLNESIEIATGEDPGIQGEFYIIVAEAVEEGEPLTKRKLVLMGSSDELRQLKLEGKMYEHYLRSEELKRKKEALAFELFNAIGR